MVNFTWNKNWITDYESPWGIFEKFKYANNITTKEFFQLFGTEYVLKKRSIYHGDYLRSLVTLEGLEGEKLESIFQIDIKKTNQFQLSLFAEFDLCNNFMVEAFVKDNLHYCPICIKTGFHSYFHQLHYVKTCPFHSTVTLEKTCPRCNRSIPYSLKDLSSRGPFMCECNYRFLEEPYFKSWTTETIKAIENREISTWTQFDEESILGMKRQTFLHSLAMNCQDKLPGYLVNSLRYNPRIKNGENHFVVFSIPAIQLIESFKLKCSHDNLKKRYWNEFLHYSSRQIVKSIGRNIRKTFLGHHKCCLKKMWRSNDTPCPYAIAYLFWLEYLTNFDKSRIRPLNDFFEREYYHSIDGIDFPLKVQNDFLRYTSNTLEFGKEHYRLIENLGLVWLHSHIIGHLAIYHFYEFICQMDPRTIKKEDIKWMTKTDEHVPFFISPLHKSKEDSLEFHWWDSHVLKAKIVTKIREFICPNNSVKKRRKIRYFY